MPSSIVNIKSKFTKLCSRLAKFDLLYQKMMPIFASFLLNKFYGLGPSPLLV